MAPKASAKASAKATAKAAAVAVKVEPGVGCLEGRALHNKIQYRLRKKTCPEYIRKAWQATGRYAKGMSKDEREPFT